MKPKKLWMVTTLIALLIISGCGAAKPAATPATSTEVKTINIGYTGPMSGGAAYYGKDITDGLDLAVEDINAKGLTVSGQKYKINLVKLDDMYSPDKAATNARRLRQEYKVPVVFVAHSGGTFAIQQFNEKEGFLVAAYTSEPKVTTSGNKLTLRIPPSYASYPEAFSKIAMAKYGKNIAMIPTSSQYGKDWSTMMTATWQKLGGTIVANNPVDYGKEADFTIYVSKALAAKPDVLFVGGPSQPTALIIKQAREQGFKGGFVVMDQAKVEQMEAIVPLAQLEGVVGVVPVGLVDSPTAIPFIEKFKAKYDGKIAPWESVWNYEAMMLVAKGIEKSGNVEDATKIFEGMRAAVPLTGPDIVIDIKSIGADGGMTSEGTGITVENGKYTKPFVTTGK